MHVCACVCMNASVLWFVGVFHFMISSMIVQSVVKVVLFAVNDLLIRPIGAIQ